MRHQDWFEKLCGRILAKKDARFLWGSHDCCTFAAECIDAMTGSQHRMALAERYQDWATASGYLRDSGGLVAAISQHLGRPVRWRWFGRTGDCVVFLHKRAPTCGVLLGPLIVVPAADGLAFLPRWRILARWKV
jgi:hypothetical protein